MSARCDVLVVGGGLVGLATALALVRRAPGLDVRVCEKEPAPARHQSGRNSGVIHAGVYYRPGSRKALFARSGRAAMVDFCREHGIAHEVCGKLIVATTPAELPALAELERRAAANGVPFERVGPERVRELEPHVRAVAALHVHDTGIADYPAVARAYARLVEAGGGEIRLGARVTAVHDDGSALQVETSGGTVRTRFLVNCAGLHADRIARLCGLEPGLRIVPFRGEYYELVPARRSLVRNLVYPVPNPDFPFLGVHFTRMIDGTVHAGPNAVLALAREGYGWRDVAPRDLAEVLGNRAFWRLARRHGAEGLREMRRSLSRRAFVRSLQQLVPEVGPDDVVPAGAGVRAQALRDDGTLCDDFEFLDGPRSLHVCNAPSPGATASLPIGAEIAGRVPLASLRPPQVVVAAPLEAVG